MATGGMAAAPRQRQVPSLLSRGRAVTEEQLRNLSAAYYAACSHLDLQSAHVLAALDELELTSSTRVIYTSDHGESLGAAA